MSSLASSWSFFFSTSFSHLATRHPSALSQIHFVRATKAAEKSQLLISGKDGSRAAGTLLLHRAERHADLTILNSKLKPTLHVVLLKLTEVATDNLAFQLHLLKKKLMPRPPFALSRALEP